MADFDNDGFLDAAASVVNGRAAIWRNRSRTGNWIAFRLHGARSNRSAIGARIVVDGQTNLLTAAGSYASSVLAPVHFGLGAAGAAKSVTIHWPSGLVQSLANLPANRIHDVTETQAP